MVLITRPTFECEKDKESNIIFRLCRVVDLTKEAEMIVALERVVIVGHDVREGIRDIPRPDDGSCFPRFP